MHAPVRYRPTSSAWRQHCETGASDCARARVAYWSPLYVMERALVYSYGRLSTRMHRRRQDPDARPRLIRRRPITTRMRADRRRLIGLRLHPYHAGILPRRRPRVVSPETTNDVLELAEKMPRWYETYLMSLLDAEHFYVIIRRDLVNAGSEWMKLHIIDTLWSTDRQHAL